MNFFRDILWAKRRTLLLGFYFALATVLTVVLVYLVVAGGRWLGVKVIHELRPAWAGLALPPLWDPLLCAWTGAATAALILCGSLWKSWRLRAGGKVVAAMLGGRPIAPGTESPDERQVLNIVEEMAIASGLRVPPVYLLDNFSINAFAAGLKMEDTVIGVTRGCIRMLTRDELQGVIAHEFSHILNGDARLNVRLIGLLHGIILIGLSGAAVMPPFMPEEMI